MKRLLFILPALLLFTLLNPLYGTVGVGPAEIEGDEISVFDQVTIQDIMDLDRDVMEEKIGRKLKVKERIALKIAQKRLKRAYKKGQLEEKADAITADGKSFNIWGFILGFLLGLIGVLIAYLAIGKDAGRSSWWGLLLAVALVLIINLA